MIQSLILPKIYQTTWSFKYVCYDFDSPYKPLQSNKLWGTFWKHFDLVRKEDSFTWNFRIYSVTISFRIFVRKIVGLRTFQNSTCWIIVNRMNGSKKWTLIVSRACTRGWNSGICKSDRTWLKMPMPPIKRLKKLTISHCFSCTNWSFCF
jgi:hypothetical protein